MRLTKRQINKKLCSKVLITTNISGEYLRDVEVRVIRAKDHLIWTEVTIKIKAEVKSTQNQWLPLHQYGPKAIRNFIRGNAGKEVTQLVSSWVKLWGFRSNVVLKTIELVKQNDDI